MVALALQACGGSGSSTSDGNGGITFQPFWEGGGAGVGVPAEPCGGGFGPTVPTIVNTARIILSRGNGTGCCVAVRRSGTSFARRVVLTDLKGGNASIRVDGFTATAVPDEGLPQCATSTANPGEACGGGQAIAEYVGDPVSVDVIEGLLINVGNLCIRQRATTPTPVPTLTATNTSVAATATPTPTFTSTQAPTPTSTIAVTATATSSPTNTFTTPLATATPTETATGTASVTPTETATATVTETPTATASATPADVTLRIGSATGTAGQVVSFSVTISTAGRSVDATQNEITFSPNAPIAPNGNNEPDCTSMGSIASVFLPIGCTPPACTGARFTYAQMDIPDGTVLYTCNVSISSTAPPGALALACQNATYADASNQFPALCTDGAIVVQ